MEYFNHITQEFVPGINVEKVIKRVEELEEENFKLKVIMRSKILLVEDGSVDIDRLEEDGFYVIPYRQGSQPPIWLTHPHKGE